MRQWVLAIVMCVTSMAVAEECGERCFILPEPVVEDTCSNTCSRNAEVSCPRKRGGCNRCRNKKRRCRTCYRGCNAYKYSRVETEFDEPPPSWPNKFEAPLQDELSR